MGLFSKILGEVGSELNLDKIVKTVADAVEKVAGDQDSSSGKKASADADYTRQAEPAYEEEGPSGFSWGPVMPDEPNQFNYNGSYIAYFAEIFHDEFPEYNVTQEAGYGGAFKSTVFYFWKDGRNVLVVELLPKSSTAKMLRQNCAMEGIPYLRYYYNHEGWWNTRAYVIQRTRNALA